MRLVSIINWCTCLNIFSFVLTGMDGSPCTSTMLAMHWRCQNLDHVSSTHDMFFKDGELSTRYFHHDGIHLTASGTKRLLDALNRGFQVVKDFDNCVFTGKRNMNKANIGSGFHVPKRSYQGQFQAGRRPASGRSSLICHQKGHKIADC